MIKSLAVKNKINESFEKKCLVLLFKAYQSAMIEDSILIDWEEESISAHIVKHIRKFQNKFIVNYEVPLVEEEVVNGKKRVKNSNRIDIFFQKSQWEEIKYLEYHIEAKNISSKEWKKSIGSKVNASQQQKDYITEGMDRFLTGHFKNKKGCMLGYLVNGTLEEVLIKVNLKIESKKSNNEIISLANITVFEHQIFKSIHSERTLKHLFFNFVN